MYTLVLRCRDAIKPGSVPHKFRKWVTAEVLPSIRKNGVYSKTKKALLGKITFEQQEAIKQLVMNRGKALPKDRQAKAMITMWSALKSHFGVSYKEIEESQFAEALSLAARVPLEGELMPPVFLPTPEPSVDLSMEIHNIGIACGHIEYIWRVWGSELYPALKAVRSPLAYELMDRIRDSCAIVNTVRRGLERNRG
ncbi:hypothetical protein BIY29_05355 [Brenneria alni]|uniref:Bro-N domain-containing protein n=1 Tax=Brenneria alni TaxID=71656 RepID=A0A421DQY3_9GAMM|nr:hypothetical protein BIY29_05355 [Brenneria alni]